MSSILYVCSSAISNYKGEELSTYTKRRLEVLGIDPNSVNTESQAQLIIAQAEAAANNSGKQQKQGGNSSREQLVSEAEQLAQKIGINISKQDSLENMLNKISEELNIMVQNPYMADIVRDYQAELTDIAKRADIIVNVQKNIFNEMEMISVSNRLILGL